MSNNKKKAVSVSPGPLSIAELNHHFNEIIKSVIEIQELLRKLENAMKKEIK